MRRARRRLGQLEAAGRPAQRVRVEPLDLGLRVAVEQAGQLGVGADGHGLAVAGVQQVGRVQHVQLDVGGQRDAVGVLGQALEHVLVQVAADALELEHGAGARGQAHRAGGRRRRGSRSGGARTRRLRLIAARARARRGSCSQW